MWGRKFVLSFIQFFECFFLIFHFKHVLKEVGRKVSMDKGFKAQLYLWALPPSYESWFTNSGIVWTWITSSITRKVVLDSTSLEGLLMRHINFDRNTGGQIFKIKWLFKSNISYNSYSKSFIGLGFYLLHPWTPTAKARPK